MLKRYGQIRPPDVGGTEALHHRGAATDRPQQPVPMPRQHSMPTPSPILPRVTVLAGNELRTTTVMEAVLAASNEERTQDLKNSRDADRVCVRKASGIITRSVLCGIALAVAIVMVVKERKGAKTLWPY